MAKPMNVIYFNPDELRADVLACYGHPLVETPNFDRLATEGTRFDQCHVQHTVCSPSRCSFMTGWYPHTRGHRTLWSLLQPDEPNTLKYLKQVGYDVHWIGKNDLLAEASYPDSVTRVEETHRTDTVVDGPEIFQPDEPGFYSFLRGPMETDGFDNDHVEDALKFLRSRRPDDPPFMLFLAISFPHCPYRVPEPWYSMYSPEDVPPLRPADLAGKPDLYRMIREYRNLQKADEALFRKIMAVYLGMVSYVDHLLGKVLDALDELNLADPTAVFAFSDHGDWAGDYGLPEKWPSALDDCLTRVPMLVRVPGQAAGHVVHEPIECFDIVPTTLELAGVEAQHTHFARSMMPLLAGTPGDPDRAVFAEGGYDTHEPHGFEGKPEDLGALPKTHIYYPKGAQQQEHPETVCRSVMLRTLTHKLVRRTDGQHELYDLQADPLELHNVYGHPDLADIQGQLLERLTDWYVHTADVVPWNADFRGHPARVKGKRLAL